NESDTGKVSKKTEEAIKIAMLNGVSVFPNPAQDHVNIAINNFEETEIVQLYVTDNTGKNIYSQKIVNSQTQVDVSSYKQGIYYFQLSKGKETLFYKVVKLE
ncbi:MAG TPA: T9SS type A sorting domain-containing protein, partial [Nitrosopumilaceae archaeon]|nr:T9SS type A sorting domain-containing protein [Nitrosopumilaceae archaeon]